MSSLLRILHVTLYQVANAVLSGTFLLIIFLVFMMYKKNEQVSKHSIPMGKNTLLSNMIHASLFGILTGIIGSFILVTLGISLQISRYLLFLLPIAILLAMFNMRYLCFSYAGGVLGILGLIFRGNIIFGIQLPTMNLDIPGLLALVAVLHCMESILIFTQGASGSIPLVIKRNGKIAAAYLMQKFWPIPFALLVLQLQPQVPTQSIIAVPEWWPLTKMASLEPNMLAVYFIYPLVAALGYGNIAISTSPEKKAKRSSKQLMIYSTLLLFLAVLSVERIWIQLIGVLFMTLAHELIIIRDQFHENKSVLYYDLPEKGVRILELKSDGAGETMGLVRGDIIQSFNGTEIQDMNHLQRLLDHFYTVIWMDVLRADGSKKYIEFTAYPSGINDLDIIPLPQNPVNTYKIDTPGLHHILRRVQKNN